MVKVFDIISRVAHDGSIIGAISREAAWELEELKGSTNRLIVEVPLEDSMDVSTDEELLFRKRRYIITELSRHKNSRITEIIADEAQTELASRRVKRLQLNKATLADAVTKALSGTAWKVGTVFDPDTEFNAEIENQTVDYCLSFLVSQSGGRIKFDSVNKTVSILDNAEEEPVTTFHYKRNLDDISKTEVQPKATVLYPYGKEGMTIESLNDGNDFIEDFSWYTGLGMTLAEARNRFRKEMVWEDNRFIYSGNLLREAKKKLAALSHPQINYAIKAASLQSMNLHIDDSVYVVDEELGIKIKTIVSRVITSNDPTRNEVELDYVPSSLSDVVAGSAAGDSVGGSSSEAVFVSKNADSVTLSNVPSPVLSTSITVIAATFFHVSLAVQLNVTTAGTIRGYFMMDGAQIPTTIRQSATEGWYTIGLPFIITQVQEGTKNLDFYLYVDGGAGEVEAEGIELYVTSKGALGGTRNERPDQRVSDHIDLPNVGINLQDDVDVKQQRPVNPKVMEHIQLPLTVIEMTDNVSIELNGPITDPDTIPDGEIEATEERTGFGIMANYEAYMAPSQEQVDQFITDHDANRVFKIISIGEQVFVFTTVSGSISVNYFERKVSSTLPMDILTPSGELIDEVLEVDWLANVGVIKEHELYLHSPDKSTYNKYLASVPVPPDRTYDNLFIYQRADGRVIATYSNGDIIKDFDPIYPDRLWLLGTENYAYQYIWDEVTQEWEYNTSTTVRWHITHVIESIIFTSSTLYQYDTNTVFREADDLSLITWKHLTEIPDFPTEWRGKDWVITKHASEDAFRLYIAKGTLHMPRSSGLFGTEGAAGWYSYKWDGTSWIFRSESPNHFESSSAIVLYTANDMTNYITGEIVYPAGYTDTSSLLNTPEMSEYSKYLASVPIPPDRTYDNMIIFETDEGAYLYFTNGNVILDHPEWTNWLGDQNYYYAYKWDESIQEWTYSRNSSGTVLSRNLTNIVFSNSDLYSKDTSTVKYGADDLSLITWKHLTEIPVFPTEWQGKNWVIIKLDASADIHRLYIVNGTIHAPKSNADFGSEGVRGWYNYKWDGSSWVFRSENTNYFGGTGITAIFSASDITNYNTGELVYPAGYTNTVPLLNT